MIDRNPWLVVGGWMSLAASALHIGCIFGGPDWFRFFGAGERMARMAENGDVYPTLVTFGIAAILAIWAAYAFAGAGLIRRLPLMRTALVLVSAIYLIRGAVILAVLAFPTLRTPFNIWSSLIVLAYGIVYSIGTLRAWPRLSIKESFA